MNPGNGGTASLGNNGGLASLGRAPQAPLLSCVAGRSNMSIIATRSVGSSPRWLNKARWISGTMLNAARAQPGHRIARKTSSRGASDCRAAPGRWRARRWPPRVWWCRQRASLRTTVWVGTADLSTTHRTIPIGAFRPVSTSGATTGFHRIWPRYCAPRDRENWVRDGLAVAVSDCGCPDSVRGRP
jgi:hypothetical protein